MTPAAWHRISQALAHYQGLGFEYVDVPWLVGDEAYFSTTPRHAEPLKVGAWREFLVASAEQSFLHMALDGRLVFDRELVALTPCFRDEYEYTDLTRASFMKVELLSPTKTTLEMAMVALSYFQVYAPEAKLVPTDAGIDIEWCGIELGSYGRREYSGHSWTYGTGLAEPRLSASMERNRK